MGEAEEGEDRPDDDGPGAVISPNRVLAVVGVGCLISSAVTKRRLAGLG